MMNLFTGSGVGPTVLYLALSIFIGLLLGKIKIAKISLGITWVLFVGIAFSACGISLNAEMLHIIKEFGLILFVVAVGLQVGPGFFQSFKKGGLATNLMALVNVALGVLITVIIAKVAKQDLADMAGVYTGAITNTPGLSAAQQAVTDIGIEGAADRLAAGYAVAYPLAVVGMIVTCILLRILCRIDLAKEPTDLSETTLNSKLKKRRLFAHSSFRHHRPRHHHRLHPDSRRHESTHQVGLGRRSFGSRHHRWLAGREERLVQHRLHRGSRRARLA